jgi:hypothetical protein
MSAFPRSRVVDPDNIGVYHVWNRAVRQAFLLGVDPISGVDYSYRRDWIELRLEQLAGLYAVEVGFYATMGNHFHMVLRTRPDIVQTWSAEEVARRWLTITRLAKAMHDGVPTPDPRRLEALLKDDKQIARLRRRLSSVSWFMGTIGENIARRVNQEDQTQGHFWEERFSCRECIDESAILVCGIYVDLNQIRAGEAQTPETSRRTSAYRRIEGRHEQQQGNPRTSDGWLCELTLREGPYEDREGKTRSRSGRRASDLGLIGIKLDDYLRLLDWSGRQVRQDKPGAIPADLAPILERLHIRGDEWLGLLGDLNDRFGNFLGRAAALAAMAAKLKAKWLKGAAAAARVFT